MQITTHRPARLLTLAALALTVACGGGGRTDYATDGDTGTAAPATVPTYDSPHGPDSTSGISERSGKIGSAGDTLVGRSTTPGKATPEGNQAPGKRP